MITFSYSFNNPEKKSHGFFWWTDSLVVWIILTESLIMGKHSLSERRLKFMLIYDEDKKHMCEFLQIYIPYCSI